MDEVKPIFGRVGGKARLAPWIIEFIKQHQFSIYCEPFAGSAAVYFRMMSEGIFEEIKQRGHHPELSSMTRTLKSCNCSEYVATTRNC